MSTRSRNLNSVFYSDVYHPIQAGSIDGTDILPHDNAILRAQLCSSIGLYDPFGDPKATGDPYCTLFVGRLSRLTTEDTLRKVMSQYGRIKKLRLVRDIVTGASRGYAFVEFEAEREMRQAYTDAHHLIVDDCEIIVDYNRQQLMPGWIPRRLGGGLSGNKESGQLRFGGREKPFRAPLKPIPYAELKKLGIPPPPEGRYMSRFEVPSPPRRERNLSDKEEDSSDRNRTKGSLVEMEEAHYRRSSSHQGDHLRGRSSSERSDDYYDRSSSERHDRYRDKTSSERSDSYHDRSSSERSDRYHNRSSSKRRDRSSERSDRYHDRSSSERSDRYHDRNSSKRSDHSSERSDRYHDRNSSKRSDRSSERSSLERSGSYLDRSSLEGADRYRDIKSSERSDSYNDRSSSERSGRYKSSTESDKHSRKRKERGEHSPRQEKYSRYSPHEED